MKYFHLKLYNATCITGRYCDGLLITDERPQNKTETDGGALALARLQIITIVFKLFF